MISDSCPDWADILIKQLYEIETMLGNLPRGSDWESDYVGVFAKRSLPQGDFTITEEHAHMIFEKVVRRLSEHKYSTEEITSFINKRIFHPSCPPYCSDDEVKEVIHSL